MSKPKIIDTNYVYLPEKRITKCILTLEAPYRKVIGIAKCLPTDEWEDKIGKRISNLDAHIKYHQINSWATRESLADIEKFYNKTYEQFCHHQDAVEKLKAAKLAYGNKQ